MEALSSKPESISRETAEQYLADFEQKLKDWIWKRIRSNETVDNTEVNNIIEEFKVVLRLLMGEDVEFEEFSPRIQAKAKAEWEEFSGSKKVSREVARRIAPEVRQKLEDSIDRILEQVANPMQITRASDLPKVIKAELLYKPLLEMVDGEKEAAEQLMFQDAIRDLLASILAERTGMKTANTKSMYAYLAPNFIKKSKTWKAYQLETIAG